MATINVHEAKTHFSRLLSRVESGEEVIIAKAGKPVAKLLPFQQKGGKRTPGSAKGKIVLKKGFLEPLSKSLLDEFEK
jgi:prevent-host-death family protein